MPLVLRHQVPDGRSVLANRPDHLLGLVQGHARVVAARDDEDGFGDLRGVVERGRPRHELAHRGVALVAVLGPSKVSAVSLRAFEERDEVRDADDGEERAHAVAVARGDGEGHVPAVTAARHHDAARVESGLSLYPVEQRADVFVRVLALHAVVEREEGLAVARGAADVRVDDCRAHLVEEVIIPSEEVRARLALRAAVYVDDDGARAVELTHWRHV